MNDKLKMFDDYFNSTSNKDIEIENKDTSILPEYNNYSTEELRIMSSPDNVLSKLELVYKANLIFQ
jgi:hypothetical protein